MTLENYKESIRKYRGHLKSVDVELDSLWNNGTKDLLEYSLSNKGMGVRKMCEMSLHLSDEQQDAFVTWMKVKKRCKNEVDVKLLGLI